MAAATPVFNPNIAYSFGVFNGLPIYQQAGNYFQYGTFAYVNVSTSVVEQQDNLFELIIEQRTMNLMLQQISQGFSVPDDLEVLRTNVLTDYNSPVTPSLPNA